LSQLRASLDALVLKAVTLVQTQHLKPHISNQCVHVKGNDGGKKAVRQITMQLKDNSFVFRFDVKNYYARIDHHILMKQLHVATTNPAIFLTDIFNLISGNPSRSKFLVNNSRSGSSRVNSVASSQLNSNFRFLVND
jgi:hypothetical protein